MGKWLCTREAGGPDLSLACRGRKRRRKYRAGWEWVDEGRKRKWGAQKQSITNRIESRERRVTGASPLRGGGTEKLPFIHIGWPLGRFLERDWLSKKVSPSELRMWEPTFLCVHPLPARPQL